MRSYFSLMLLTSLLLVCSHSALAVVPSDQLLPATTKGYVSIGDVDRLQADFDKTQLGQLMADPVMEPFAEDLRRQLKEKWSRMHEPLGLTWEDMQGVPGGEVGMARIQPGKGQAAAALIVDVTGKLDEANELLAKVQANMKEKKADKKTREISGLNVTIYTHTRGKDKGAQAVYFLHPTHNQLVATDDLQVTQDIITRFGDRMEGSLSGVASYQAAMQRVEKAQGDLVPHVRWFLEPFGYVDVIRVINPDRGPKKKKDIIQVLRNQGFTAVQGIGGLVTLKDGQHEILHRTMVYAPAIKRAPDDPSTEKYDLAMRMLKFVNGNNHAPLDWVPRDLATFVSFNADLINGFEHSKTLVNELADDDIFDDVIRSLRDDPAGPRVDVRKEVVSNLGEHVMVLTDYELPVTPNSERMLACIELTNVPAVVRAVNKVMENDPNAERRRIGDHIVWEIVEEEAEVPDFEFQFEFEQFEQPEDKEEKEEEKSLPTSAVTVAHGHLLVGTHLDLIRKVLEQADRRRTMAGSIDYQVVQEAIQKLGAGNDCAQYFSRTDEEYRATYELLRQGKMPESKTLVARMLNFMFDDGDDETVRKQQIDGSKLPEFQMVRRYLGPAGIFVVSENDGWLATGCLLKSL